MNAGGAYGGGKAGGAFDLIIFVQRPQVILRALCWVCTHSFNIERIHNQPEQKKKLKSFLEMKITYLVTIKSKWPNFCSRIKQTLEICYRFFSFLSVLSQVEVVAITGLKLSSVYTQSTHDTVSTISVHTAPRRRMAITCVGVVQYYIIFINTYDDNQMDLDTCMYLYLAHEVNVQFSQMTFLSWNTLKEWSNYTRNICIHRCHVTILWFWFSILWPLSVTAGMKYFERQLIFRKNQTKTDCFLRFFSIFIYIFA